MGILTNHDIYLFREGTHATLYQRLGCHFFSKDDKDGAHVAVWAPNARDVSVIGAWNDWKPGPVRCPSAWLSSAATGFRCPCRTACARWSRARRWSA